MNKTIACGGLGLAALLGLFAAAPAAAQTLKFTNELGSACLGKKNPAAGVAVDPRNGHVVVTTAATGQACILDSAGNLVALLTTDGTLPFPFIVPVGVAVDPDTSQIVVADAGDGEDPNNGHVWVFDSNGVFSGTQLTLLGSDPGFDTPTGIAIDASISPTRGQIIVTDFSFVTDTPAIRAFNAVNPDAPSATRNGGTAGSEQILNTDVDGPFSTAIDSAGNVWIGDPEDEAIYEYSAALTNPAILTSDGSGDGTFVPGPLGLAFDPANGTLAIAVELGLPEVALFSRPGAPSVANPLVASARPATRHSIVPAGRFAKTHAATPRVAPQSRHAASWIQHRLAAAAQRQPRKARPDCNCEVDFGLVTSTPLLLTDGEEYLTDAFSDGGFTGGQEFVETETPPDLFPVVFTGPNTLLAGVDTNGLLQRFIFAPLIPTLGAVAALGFAALLGLTGLMRLRRRASA